MRAAALVVVLACGHAEPPAPAAPKGPTGCDRAADSMVAAMVARLPSSDAASDAPTETADALRRLIRERCEQDGWTDAATRCLTAMKRLEDAEPCAAMMTEAQQAALARAEDARLGSAAESR